jgi:hypothetical protein
MVTAFPFWPVSADGTFSIDHLVAGAGTCARAKRDPLGYTMFSVVRSLAATCTNCVVRETTTLVLSSDDTLACILRAARWSDATAVEAVGRMGRCAR